MTDPVDRSNPSDATTDPRLGDGTAWMDDGPDATTVDGDSPLMGLWRDAWVATSFLTRLPLHGALIPPAYRDGATIPTLSASARAFPLAGLAVGIIGALALTVASGLGMHPLAAALVGLASAVLVTGALHEDGLADVADGFGGGATADDKKDIMRDSRIGTYGVMALVFAVGLRAGALVSFATPGDAAFALLGAVVMARAVLPGVMLLFDSAREDGLGAGAGRPTRDAAVTAAGLGALFGFLFLGFMATVVASVLAVVSAYAVAALAKRQIGGITGDVLGAVVVVVELAVLVAAVAVYG